MTSMYNFTSFLAAATTTDLSSSGSVGKLEFLDFLIIGIYLVGVVGIGLYAGVLMKRGKKDGADNSKDYFLAGGTLKWPVIGLALFATNISCYHLVSLAQAGFDDGLLAGNFEWMAAFTLILLSLFFAPFYLKSKVATLPDFLEKRYSRSSRDILTVFSLFGAVVVHIGFAFLTGGIVIQDLFGINMYTGIAIIAVLTGIYTVVGGLLAVVLTEAIQTVILIIGALVITWLALDKMGGWDAMVTTLEANKETQKLSMLRGADDPSGLPWFAIMLGYPILGIWYWCADQTIVQRVLGAKDENHARVGPLFAGILKILPVFIFVLPGLLAFTLAKTGGLDLSGITGADGNVESKKIYTTMIAQLLPVGVKGLIVAALLAALMSTVSGALNSISTLTAYDLYKRFKPDTSDKKLVFIGRIAAGVAVLVSIALVALLNKAPNIFYAMNDIIGHLAPPVTCVFLLGVFWKKANAFSAKWTMLIGAAVGGSVYGFSKLAPWWPKFTGGFMMMAFYLFVFCVILQVSLTYLSGQKVSESSGKLCWDHPLDPIRQPGWKGIGNYKFLSVLLLVMMAVLYYIFR